MITCFLLLTFIWCFLVIIFKNDSFLFAKLIKDVPNFDLSPSLKWFQILEEKSLNMPWCVLINSLVWGLMVAGLSFLWPRLEMWNYIAHWERIPVVGGKGLFQERSMAATHDAFLFAELEFKLTYIMWLLWSPPTPNCKLVFETPP